MADVMKEDDEQQQQGEELVIVEDEKSSKSEEPTGVEDEREAINKGDDADDEREGIRERRRKERQERKERRQESISRDKLELDFLRKRNDELERRVSVQEQRTFSLDISGIDAQIVKAQQEIEMAERVIAKAVAAGNGDDVAQALRYRDQAFAAVHQLNAHKAQATHRQISQTPAKNALDDITLNYAKEFIEENSWYDPQGRDEDSAIVLAIDQGLVKDGYRTDTEEYWDELRRRASKRLPERFEADASPESSQRKPRGGPAVGSSREHAPASTRKEIYISPERKTALIEAGVWDDPLLRSKYVKRYAEYDRQKKTSA